MAAFDIMPFNSALGQTNLIHFGKATSSLGLLVGELCRIAAAGTLTEVSTATSDNVAGVVINGPVSATAGDSRTINPATGAAWAANDLMGYVVAAPGQRFVTRNFSTGGTNFGDTPTLAHIGDPAGTIVDGSGLHGVYASPAQSARNCRIVDVLDSQKKSIQITGNTGVYVVFEFTTTQFTSVTAAS